MQDLAHLYPTVTRDKTTGHDRGDHVRRRRHSTVSSTRSSKQPVRGIGRLAEGIPFKATVGPWHLPGTGLGPGPSRTRDGTLSTSERRGSDRERMRA
ncbi:hypothetical protein TNCT6_55760 [Streptomyces sp. 6-11-2]|nr:hypothetical protein TNCT6_55760 [Streptomyces sp. 6-11-2]